MKVAITTLDEAKKNKLEYADALLKSDLLVIISTKAKTEIPSDLKEAMDEIKAEIEFVKVESASEVLNTYSYYIGFHAGKGHQVFTVSAEKPKLPSMVLKQAKAYTSFKNVVGAENAKKSTTSKTSTSTAAKKTSSSKTSSSKTSSSKTSTAKKASTAKKTTTKKSTSSKKKTSKDADNLSDVLESLASGKLDTDALLKTAKKAAKKAITSAVKEATK